MSMLKVTGSGIPDRAVPMRVIVCGLHRTGTLSMRSALWHLGFHDCYHMHSVFENIDSDPALWIRALEAKFAGQGYFTTTDWDRLLGHCQACCDLPAALFTCDLADVYPDAKIILLSRDPVKWYASVLDTVSHVLQPRAPIDKLRRIYVSLFDPVMHKWTAMSRTMNRLAFPFDHAKEKAKAIAWYNAHYDEIRQHVSAERRLEFAIQDGWAPLCEFLNVPIPTVLDEQTGKMQEAPFPHVNDRAAFARHYSAASRQAVYRATSKLLDWAGHFCLLIVIAYGGFEVWRRQVGAQS